MHHKTEKVYPPASTFSGLNALMFGHMQLHTLTESLSHSETCQRRRADTARTDTVLQCEDEDSDWRFSSVEAE